MVGLRKAQIISRRAARDKETGRYSNVMAQCINCEHNSVIGPDMCENCGKSRTVKNDLDEILTVDETPFDEPMTVDADWTALFLDKMVAADVARLHPKRKLFRDGTSSRTLRRKKMLNAKAHRACPMQRLDNWFLVSGAPTEEATPNMPDLACVKQLQEILTGKDLNTRLFVKLAVVLKFFEARMDGASRLSAATTAANCLPSVFHLGPRTVQNWAKAYARDGQLPESQRGKHQKSSSMIHDEDFLFKCGKWLRTTLPPQRTPRNFQLYLNEILLPSLTGALQTTVSIETSRWWMIHAGYKYGAWSKDEFLDGHERHDVVEYRADFCRKWIELSKRMVSYTGPDMETVECRENSVLEPVVWLTHDESVFYANDDGGMIWTNSAHPDLPKKSRGRSIMVSGFLCPCHGRLYMPVGERQQYVRELLHIGKTQEGYWTSDHVVALVKDKVLPAFPALHPGCLALITFDQSTNHAAFAPDALRTTSMNLDPGGKQDKMRDGWYGLNRTHQKMVFPEDHHVIDLRGKAKGIKAVLVERGAWKPSMRLTCGVAVDIPPSPAILECCARHCLASFDDFRSQKSVLEEIVTSAGHVCMFYPKYHCELNPIESYWGAAKRYARQHCDYSWNGLVRCVPASLSSVPLSSIRKFFRRCSHYIQAYNDGINIAMTKYAHKQYKSHRRIPQSIATHINIDE